MRAECEAAERSATDPDPRLGPRAKVDRAKEHLAEFKRAVDGFIASEPYKFDTVDDAGGLRHIVLKSHEPLPLRLSTIAGDIVHNLRSSLDVLVTCAGMLESNELQNLKFPIYRERTDFEKRALKGDWNHSPRAARFVKLLKPYERGLDLGHHGHTLVLLNRLSNLDKHRLIITVGTAAAYCVVEPAAGFGDPFRLEPPPMDLLAPGDIVMTMSRRDPLFAGKRFNTHLTVQVRLSGVGRMPPVGAASVLAHLVKTVDRIVLIAERTLFRFARPPVSRNKILDTVTVGG